MFAGTSFVYWSNLHLTPQVTLCLPSDLNVFQVHFGKLFQTLETNSKQTSFWPVFVRNYVTLKVSLEVYQGLKYLL